MERSLCRVRLVQFDSRLGVVEDNLRRRLEAIEQAVAEGRELRRLDRE
jgi:hypothetical protein